MNITELKAAIERQTRVQNAYDSNDDWDADARLIIQAFTDPAPITRSLLVERFGGVVLKDESGNDRMVTIGEKVSAWINGDIVEGFTVGNDEACPHPETAGDLYRLLERISR